MRWSEGAVVVRAVSVRGPTPPPLPPWQAWLLSCIPEFKRHTVAELNAPNLRVDSSQFPQIYQRDEG